MTVWNIDSLYNITDLVTDGKHGDCQNENNSGYYFISSKDVYNNKINYEDSRQITEKDFRDTHRRTRLASGDIVLTNSGTIGRMALVKNNVETQRTTFQKSVAIIKPKHKIINNHFLYYYLQSTRKYLEELAGGTAQKNLLLGDMRKIKIPQPLLPIQRKIAAILSAYDDLIENNNRRIAILEKMAEELYREWFVRFRFPGHEEVKIVKGVPEGWEVKRIGDIVSDNNLETGKRPKGGAQEEGVPSIGAENVISIAKYNYSKEKYVNEDFFNNMKQGILKDKDILFYKDGAEIGRVSLFQDGFPHSKCCVNEHVFLIHTDNSNYQYYLYFYLSTPSLFEYVQIINKNAAQPGINKSELKSIPVIKPNSEVIEKFNTKVESLIKEIFYLSKMQHIFTRIRDRLLPRLMNGKIDVKNMDIQVPALMQEELVHG